MSEKQSRVLGSGLSRTVFPKGEERETHLNQSSPEVRALPFYNLLPDDHIELVRFRIYVRARCLTDLEFRKDIDDMCRQDVCFFANLFCWVFEPRLPPRAIPLKLWNDQADCLVWAWECLVQGRDYGAEKTRGIGFSCLIAILYVWVSRYMPEAKVAITTKDETGLDGPDANSIMGKIAYCFDRLPTWMRLQTNGKSIMRRNMTEHIMLFVDTKVTIQGFVPTNEKLRSLRFTSVLYDEFGFFPRDAARSLNASIHTAPNRFFISTWNGSDTEFHNIMRREVSTMLRVMAYWWNNEERWKGCYQYIAGRLELIDKEYEHPPGYEFVSDGLMRSPWVDFEFSRAGTGDLQKCLEELYGLQAASGRKFFRLDTIEIVNSTVKTPKYEGDIERINGRVVFRAALGGPIKLFCDYDDNGLIGGAFSAACDLSKGVGATYSTLELVSLSGGEQALDLARDDLPLVAFAQYVFDVLQWANGERGDGHTYLTFENNGETTFGEELLRLGYGNIQRSAYRSKVPRDKEPTYLGQRNIDGGKAILLELERAIRDGECTVYSNDVAYELATFDKSDEDGSPNYPKGEKSHGDRAQAFAMAWFQARLRVTVHHTEKQHEATRRELQEIGGTTKQLYSEKWSFNRR